MRTRIEAVKQPEYIGENRCTPCTVVNVGIAAVLAAGVGVLAPPAGVTVFVLSLAAIYLRGYLVPGTPTLTKRYFPDRVLRWFDKAPEREATDEFVPAAETDPADDGAATTSTTAPTAASEAAGDSAPEAPNVDDPSPDGDDHSPDDDTSDDEISPERLLVDLDVVEPCESVDDLCLTDSFERSWREAIHEHRDDVTDPTLLADLFDVDPEHLEVKNGDDTPLVQATGIGRQRWMSRGALLVDATANSLLVADHDRWAALEPHQRLPMLKALRSFLPACPLCGGSIEMGNETVESCCRSWEVIAVSCNDCEERYLEVDASRVEDA